MIRTAGIAVVGMSIGALLGGALQLRAAAATGDCTKWQVRFLDYQASFKARENGADVVEGWEPFAAHGFQVVARRCADK